MYRSSHHIHKTTNTECHALYKHGYVTLHTNTECHTSQRLNLPQFIALRDACLIAPKSAVFTCLKTTFTQDIVNFARLYAF